MINFSEIDFNEEFVQGFDLLENTSQHIFITGKAGTGKSTLLRYFREKTRKNVVVLAPTGIAAINVKGQTIHAFFGFKPDVTPETVGDIPVRRKKRKLFEELQSVIIDEISMVRADLLDCVDIFLRLYGPHTNKPFGGVQIIFFGDLFQLPPVVSSNEELIFKSHYASPYFFSSKVFITLDFKIFHLTKIYRQKDSEFIRLLNALRDNRVVEEDWKKLNRRFNPKSQISSDEFYIVLTTTNALAEKVNTQRLKILSTENHVYHGIITGDFERKSLPTPEILELKEGAQVMMLTNDVDKRWVNGSLGKINRVIKDTDGDDVLMVTLESGDVVDIKRHTWEIYQYYFDDVNNALGSKVIGYFTQYPLKLAWAVTIHKSQGQTFERVVIDIGWGTFSHGQIYVALSRCTTLEGIVLKQPLAQRHILMDTRVIDFMKKFICLILCLWVHVGAFAQTPQIDRGQVVTQDLSAIEDKQLNPNLWQERNADQPYIGLLTETDTVIHPDWSFDQDYHARVKIQKEAAKNLGQWPIYYNKSRERITEIKAYIETVDGKKLLATDIKDIDAYDHSPIYADLRIKLITFPPISLGTIIDVHVKTKVFKESIPQTFWDEITYPSIPTKYARNSYIFPKDLPIQFKAFNTDKKPLIENLNNQTKYSYIFENTNYSDNAAYIPPVDDVLGVISVSSINDWQVIADWWRKMVDLNTVEDPLITGKALNLIDSKVTQKDKARAILEFVQDNFRYVAMSLGDHTTEMHSSREVFKNHYGDSKDLAILARQMLKAVGIESKLCLFSGEFNGDPAHRLPSASAFDHLILQLNLDHTLFYVDPQAKGFDIGQLPSSYDNAHVLVIDDKGFHFDNLAVGEADFHALTSSSDIFLTDDGSANFDVSVELPVEASVDLKNNWQLDSQGDKAKFFDRLSVSFAQGGKIKAQDVKGLEERYGTVKFTFKYAAAKVYQIVNDMLLLKEDQTADIPDFALGNRKVAVFIPSNSIITNRNTYHLPDSLKINFIPADYNLETAFMAVSVNYRKIDGGLKVESAYRLKRALIPSTAFDQIDKFQQALELKNQLYVILKKKTSVSTQAKSWLKAQ